MSMRVFYAYLFKENAEFKDIYEATKYVNELRKKFINWVPNDMLKWPKLLELDHFGRLKQLEDDTKCPEKGGLWDYQLQCTLFAREVNGINYIALQFFPSGAAAKFLKENVELREFWYQNQTDDGFDLPDWELRESFWEEVYKDYWSPSRAGLTCDIYDGTDFRTTDSIIMELEKLKPSPKE